MVYIKYKCRLGNRMFQHAYARIITKHLGYGLKNTSPIPNDPLIIFPNTEEKIEGIEIPLTWEGDFPKRDQAVLAGEEAPEIVEEKTKGKTLAVFISSYCEQYNIIKKNKEFVKSLFKIPNEPDLSRFSLTPETLVVHLRLGDFKRLNRTLPQTWYDSILEKEKPENILIITEDKTDPDLAPYKQKGYKVESNDILTDFCLLKASNRLVTSCSTFSWWAAFLGKAEVILPYSQESTIKMLKEFSTNIKVDDDPRYLYKKVLES